VLCVSAGPNLTLESVPICEVARDVGRKHSALLSRGLSDLPIAGREPAVNELLRFPICATTQTVRFVPRIRPLDEMRQQ